jgi:UPF0755 protein
MENYRYWIKFAFISIGIVLAMFFAVYYFGGFGAAGTNKETERFIVPRDNSNIDIMRELKAGGFINSEWAFNFALNFEKFGHQIGPGAYKLSNSMNAWQISEIFVEGPYMKWVTIPEGLRKEEIAEILARELGWGSDKKQNWITKDTTISPDHIEGVYFPDTYLIPVAESGAEVAKRLRTKFEENFQEFFKEASSQNIKWTTVVKLASIIQRESSGKEDVALISGILWNRLEKDMRLDIDATLQYARGDMGAGWWAPIKVDDKNIDSPYNTYKYKGLPPHPICNPGLDALRAVLYPEETTCLFYLHDNKGQLHCAEDYDGHLKNIKEFLK